MRSNLSRAGRRRFWETHLEQCNESGLSQAEYCRSNKISLKSFQYWRRKSKRTDSPEQAAPALVEVPLSRALSVPDSSAHPQLCLVVDRYRIEIGRGFNSEDFERVLLVLGRI